MTITIDTSRGEQGPASSAGSGRGGGTGPSANAGGTSGAGGSGDAASVTAFQCPQCGEPLEGTSCECGFEFDADDLQEGSVTVEGALPKS